MTKGASFGQEECLAAHVLFARASWMMAIRAPRKVAFSVLGMMLAAMTNGASSKACWAGPALFKREAQPEKKEGETHIQKFAGSAETAPVELRQAPNNPSRDWPDQAFSVPAGPDVSYGAGEPREIVRDLVLFRRDPFDGDAAVVLLFDMQELSAEEAVNPETA